MKKKLPKPSIIIYKNRNEIPDNILIQCINLRNQANLFYHQFAVNSRICENVPLADYYSFFTDKNQELYLLIDGNIKEDDFSIDFSNIKVIGLLEIYKSGADTGRKTIYVQNIFIDSDYRQHGYASKLVRKMYSENPGCQFSINVICNNEAAINFWKEMGFTTPYSSLYYLNWDDYTDEPDEDE